MSKTSVLTRMRGLPGYNNGDNCCRISMKTGTIAAALAANSVLFSTRPGDGGSVPQVGFIEKIRVQYTCITSFAVPIVAGRSLAFAVGTGTPGSGTALVRPFNKGNAFFTSTFGTTGFGETFIADTAGLAGVTVSLPDRRLAELSLTGFGTAGDVADVTFNLSGDDNAPVCISTNADADHIAGLAQLVLFNPVAMDAGGTFEVVVELDVCELPPNFVIPPT